MDINLNGNSLKNPRLNARAEKAKRLQQGVSQENKSLKETADQFEVLFVHNLMKEMRKTVPQGGLLPNNHGGKIFQDMLDEKYAEGISRRGGLGLSKIIYEQNQK